MKMNIFCPESRESKRLFKAFSFNDFSMITRATITIAIYTEGIYYKLPRYIEFVVLIPGYTK